MDVLRHQHEADTESFTLPQLLIQHAKDDSLGMIVVEQAATTVDGKRNEVGIQSVIDDPATA